MSAHATPDWLQRFSPSEWVRAGLAELEQATAASENGDVVGTIASCKRGAGMALNALLWLELAGELPARLAWGRTYVEHLRALSEDAEAPAAVRAAAGGVLAAKSGPAALVTLRLGAHSARGGFAPGHGASRRPVVLEQAHDVVAHVYALLVRCGAYVAAPYGAADAQANRMPAAVSAPAAEVALTGAVCANVEDGRRKPVGSTS
jgi:hypothetical protein